MERRKIATRLKSEEKAERKLTQLPRPRKKAFGGSVINEHR